MRNLSPFSCNSSLKHLQYTSGRPSPLATTWMLTPSKGPVMNPYAALCDDFGLFAYLNTKLDLPTSSETVVHFFETIQKSFPQMTEFARRENGEFVLEEDRNEGSLRSVTLEPRRLASAHMNPDSLEDADRQHGRVLDIAPFHLDLSRLNCDSLDVVF